MSVVRNNSKDKTLPKEQAIVIKAIKFCGGFFVLMGLMGFIFPDVYQDFFGFDQETLTLVSGCFILMGLMEIFIVPKLLRNAYMQGNTNND